MLRLHTPRDAFGNPTRRSPGRKWATKTNRVDMRQLRRAELRSGQLRYLCCGGKGAPTQLQWIQKDDAQQDSGTQSERYLMALQPPETSDPSLAFQPYDDYLEEDPEYSDDEEQDREQDSSDDDPDDEQEQV